MVGSDRQRYPERMKRPTLSDPDFEPSDADLQGLAHRAFADVRAKKQAALAKLYDEIDRARAEARRRRREKSLQ